MKALPAAISLLTWVCLAVLFMLAMAACNSPPGGAVGSADTDRQALIALYNATNGPIWVRQYNWLSNRSIRGLAWRQNAGGTRC